MNNKIASDKIHLTRIDMLQAGIQTTKKFWQNNVAPNILDFKYSKDFLLNLEEKLVVIDLGMKYKGLTSTDESEKPVGLTANYEYRFFFVIDNIEDFLSDEDKNTLDSSIVTTVLSIAFSTFRGILVEKTGGTVLGRMILPIVSPSILMSKELSNRAYRNPDY